MEQRLKKQNFWHSTLSDRYKWRADPVILPRFINQPLKERFNVDPPPNDATQAEVASEERLPKPSAC